ncbi:efflux RND transporter periplasmic adaptor subunit [Acaryochloris thomasi]|nr:efflux RND transporter periplasmic adaptor subunit [Acaryochloris thomasi]
MADSSSPSAGKGSRSRAASVFRKNGQWILLGLLSIGGGIMLWRWLSPPVSSQQAGPPTAQATLVKLQRLQASTIEDGTSFVGNLEAQEGIDLKPKVEGRVTQVFVAAGAPVQPNQPVLQLNSGKSQAEFRAALATISSARANRSNAQAELGSVQAQRAQAAAEVDLQNTEYKRTSTLVSQGVLARQELDRVTRDRNSAQAALVAADKQIQAAKANLEATKAEQAQATAAAAATREDLQDTQVVAPIAGIVGDIPIKVGDYVDIGDTLTTITQNQTLEVKLSIPLERRNQLQVGLPVEVRSFQNDRTLATGNISFISPTANAATQSVLATASFRNNGQLQDAQRVSGTVIWQKRTGVLVPTSAVSRLGGETFVFVAEPPEDEPEGLVASQRAVELGKIQGNSYQVIEGLRPGETIVTSGILNLSDGAPIEAQSE